METERLLLDGSILFDIEALETAQDTIDSTSEQVLVPQSVYDFLVDAGDYYDFKKSAPANYFGQGSIPPADYILDFLEQENVELYSASREEINYEQEHPNQIADATQYYSQFAGYVDLVDILAAEFHYLFTSSIIISAKDKISETAERIGALVTRVNEQVREAALRKAVEGHDFWTQNQQVFIEKYKLTLVACPIIAADIETAGALALLEYLLEDSISDRIVVALDP